MLTRFISTIARQQGLFVTTSVRLFNTSVPRFSDGDHARSKAKEKAAEDLKTRQEKRWLDTVASDSEAAVKGDRQHAAKQGDINKDVSNLQQDTIEAVKEKDRKGHLPEQDIGRGDTHEDRVGSGGTNKKKKH